MTDSSSPPSKFECGICFEEATLPVVTRCGHLYCWTCLNQWIERVQECPVCKAGVSGDNVTPLYGRGGNAERSSGDQSVPPRPRAERPAAPPRAQRGLGGNPFFESLGIQMGFAFLPFGFVGFMGGSDGAGSAASETEAARDHVQHRASLLMLVAGMLILALLIAS
mmetsp:Transcript_2799/g.5491  ORF Transcript_2799/g.5491 Transcript_2799/m.5491 type:complete len:166 (+) Transcript_2799:69-566(+)